MAACAGVLSIYGAGTSRSGFTPGPHPLLRGGVVRVKLSREFRGGRKEGMVSCASASASSEEKYLFWLSRRTFGHLGTMEERRRSGLTRIDATAYGSQEGEVEEKATTGTTLKQLDQQLATLADRDDSPASRPPLGPSTVQMRPVKMEAGESPSEQKSLGELTREDFPILNQAINGNRLVYLDNAATSQKPVAVLNALKDYYEGYNSNVHRGIHTLSAKSTDQYEMARSRVAKFINAPSHADVVFTRNATEAINLVAYTWALSSMQRGDEIVLSVAEHHSNLVPWQLVAEKVGVVLKFATLTEDETVDIEQLKRLISNRTRLVAVHHVSNTLGSINPVKDIIEWAHKYGAKVLVDACQSVPHMHVDVQDLDADFLVASSHKMCGPTGIGFLYGKSEILEGMPPWMGGGEMIADVYLDHSTYANPPARFEAGTPAIGEAIGLGAAVEYLTKIGMDRIHAYEMELSKYLYDSLSAIPDVKIYGPAPGARGENRAALCAFNVVGMHATDIATVLDMEHGIAVRSGHHCTQPLHHHLNINATARASLYFYNTKEEVDTFIQGLKESVEFFSSFR